MLKVKRYLKSLGVTYGESIELSLDDITNGKPGLEVINITIEWVDGSRFKKQIWKHGRKMRYGNRGVNSMMYQEFDTQTKLISFLNTRKIVDYKEVK